MCGKNITKIFLMAHRFLNKPYCRRLDSNQGPLVSEAMLCQLCHNHYPYSFCEIRVLVVKTPALHAIPPDSLQL